MDRSFQHQEQQKLRISDSLEGDKLMMMMMMTMEQHPYYGKPSTSSTKPTAQR